MTTSAETINWKYKTLLFVDILVWFAQFTLYFSKVFHENISHMLWML